MNYVKTIRNLTLGLFTAGAGLVAGGAVINEMNKNKELEAKKATIEMLKSIDSRPEVREVAEILNEIKVGNAYKDMVRAGRDAQIEQETKSALSRADNDLERAAIKAYALVRNVNTSVNDACEDMIENCFYTK